MENQESYWDKDRWPLPTPNPEAPYRGHRWHHRNLPPICHIGANIPTRVMTQAIYEVVGASGPAKTHEEQQERARRILERAQQIVGVT